MEKKTELNVTALLQLLQHVENVAVTKLTADTLNAASWLTLISQSLRTAIAETERAARGLVPGNEITNFKNPAV